MDTTDQLSGKYFFDGMNVDKEELLYWLILDEFRKQLVMRSIYWLLPLCWSACRLFLSAVNWVLARRQKGQARYHWQAEP